MMDFLIRQHAYVWLLGLAVSPSCLVDVDHGARQYSCAEDGLCPAGLECQQDICVAPGQPASDASLVADADPPSGPDANLQSDASRDLALQISSSDSDAEELVATAVVSLGSSDLELVEAATGLQIVALRFPSVDIGIGESIASASLQFVVDEVSLGTSLITIRTEDSSSPAALEAVNGNLSGRAASELSVDWAAAPWPDVGAAGSEQATPDLAALVQERVNQPEWRRGNPMVFLFTGAGTRTAVSFDGAPASAPRLSVQFE